MNDIKELAQKAGFGGQQRNTLAVKLELFAKYVIAAYLAEQEPVFKDVDTNWLASVLRHADKNPDYFPDIAEGKYSLDSSDATTISKLFTAPPKPAPQQEGHYKDQLIDELDSRAAPSSEEVREMVERLRNDETDLFRLQEQAADMIERLAARVPPDCVVVPREPTLEMVIAGENYVGRHAYKAMIERLAGSKP